MITNIPSGRSPAIAAWLCARRIELTHQFDRLDDDLWRSDRPIERFEDSDEWLDRMRAKAAYELDCIDEALFRICSDGSILCDRCNEKIEAARLETFPQTTVCGSCARG